MLGLTDSATEAIHGLVGDRPGAGLRIFPQESEGDHMQCGLSISDGPQPTDEVVEQSGCQVFVDQQVAPLVADRTLDAAADGNRYRFAFTD